MYQYSYSSLTESLFFLELATASTNYTSRPNGQTIEVPPQDVLIPTPPIGSVVTFSFESNARREDPLHPQIYRLRSDLLWEDVVYNAIRDTKYLSGNLSVFTPLLYLLFNVVIAGHLRTAGFTSQPPGYWTSKNMRLFMEAFARSKNLDPLVPETWYRISPKEFAKFKVYTFYFVLFCYVLFYFIDVSFDFNFQK